MFGAIPQPTFMPCPVCGASVARGREDEHVCDEARRRSYELARVQTETDRFEGELTTWLASPAGRFAVFYAARDRRRAA
jgi:L-rhamnose isomerase